MGRASRERESFSEQTAGSGPPPGSDQWRRVHPVTPLLTGWAVLAFIVGVLLYNVFDAARNVDGVVDFVIGHLVAVLLYTLGGVVLIVLVSALFSWIAWTRTSYAVDERAVHFHRGLVFKEQKVARLTRIQAVDVVQPLLGRIFGLAKLVIEVAGGSGSSVSIEYLSLAEAERVRAEILARAAGVDVERAGSPQEALREAVAQGEVDAEGNVVDTPGVDGEARDGVDAGPGAGVRSTGAGVPGAGPERIVYSVPTGRLIGSVLLDVGMILSAFALLVGGFLLLWLPSGAFSIAAVLPALLGIGSVLWGRLAGEANLRASVSRDGIKLRRGLTSVRTQTLPPGRVQAVRLRQGLLWRAMGWWRVQVNVAGYGGSGDDGEGESTQTVLLPVGPREDALTALWLVVADIGTDDPFATIDAALEGSGEAGGFIVSPDRARIADPIAYRHNGILITRTAMIIRRGRLTRTVIVVPHERTQSLGIEQGPWERRRGLADFTLHSVDGPISEIRAYHLDAAVAGALLDLQADRARVAREKEHPEDWLRRVGALGPEPAAGARAGSAPAGPSPDGGSAAGATAATATAQRGPGDDA